MEVEKIIENQRQGGRRDWQKRVEGRLGAREQWHVHHPEKPPHQMHFKTPQVHMINDWVQCRLQESENHTSHLPAVVSLHSRGE